MPKFRHSLTRRECRQTAWLLAAPLLLLALVFARQRIWEAPKFPVLPDTQILECRRSPLAAIGGSAYVQRVESPLSSAQFWAQTKPLLEAKGMKADDFRLASGFNRAEVRNRMQQNFRPFGLSQIAPTTQKTDCGVAYGFADGQSVNIFFSCNPKGTIIEFWIR